MGTYFRCLVVVIALLALTVLSAQAKPPRTDMYHARGVVVSKTDSTFNMNVRGDIITFRTSPDLLILIGAKGDSAHVVVEPVKGKWRVKYVVKRLSGTVTYTRKNLREDFHVVRDPLISREVVTTWGDSTSQSTGDPAEWVGTKVNWENVWVTTDTALVGRYVGFIMR